MSRHTSDAVALFAILCGLAGSLTLFHGGLLSDADAPLLQSPLTPTAVRIVGFGSEPSATLVRPGASDLQILPGSVLPVEGTDFVLSFRGMDVMEPMELEVEFLRGDLVVGRAEATALRPRVVVGGSGFGVETR